MRWPFSAQKFGSWYARYERPISSISLIGGFVFNAITLTRVDHFWENFWVIVHLVVVAACIILINREENEGAPSAFKIRNPEKLHFWLLTVMQFFFGGLLSTFIVFYFRSAVIAVAWPFFLILAVAFIANESLKRHYARIDFQISFLFLCTYLFMIFLVPVLLHDISVTVFLMSGGISLILLIGFLAILKRFTNESFKQGRRVLLSSVVGIYIVINICYFTGIIPPLPLSLQGAGIYHSIIRTSDGNYTARYEPSTTWNQLLEYVSIYPAYHEAPGEYIYAYSAIFSPVSFDTTVDHEWQRYDSASKKWITVTDVKLPIAGGRTEGYRTYSISNTLPSGKWRVNVRTQGGQLIGRMVFTIVTQDTRATTQSTVLE